MRTLYDIARLNARRFGARTALFFEDRTLTFDELDRAANGIAADLHARGIRPGERVAMLAENCLEFLPVYFGIMRLGAIGVPLNFRCAGAELDHMVRDSGSRLLFHSPAQAERAAALAAGLDEAPKTVAMTGALLALTGTAPHPRLDGSEPAVIMYTSGTTGRPKGVVLPHRSLLEQAAGTALAAGVRPSDRIVVTVPLFHGSGLYVTGHSHLYVGASLVVARRFAAEEQIALIERHGATTFFGVPTQYAMLLDAVDGRPGAPGRLRSGW